jgi:hypothetical protein
MHLTQRMAGAVVSGSQRVVLVRRERVSGVIKQASGRVWGSVSSVHANYLMLRLFPAGPAMM